MNLVTASPEATFATATREIVDDLLSMNTRNRNLRPNTVKMYQRALMSGEWVPTNQGVGVSASGFLIDGQHRLEALRACNYPPVLMLIVTGLPDAAMAAVDGGANRRPQDYLHFLFNTRVSNQVSAILRTSMLASVSFSSMTQKFSPNEYAARFDDLKESISAILEIDGASQFPAAVLAALVDAHHKGLHYETMAFARAVFTGEMLERNNPALVLRSWVSSKRGHGGGVELVIDRYRKTTKALQSWVDCKPMLLLRKTKRQTVARTRTYPFGE